MSEYTSQTAPGNSPEWIQEQTNQAVEAVRLGLVGHIPVIPCNEVPDRCSPHGMVTDEAYLVVSLSDVENLARAIRKKLKTEPSNMSAKEKRSKPYVLRNVKMRLMMSGRFQVGSCSVWCPGANLV